MARTRGRPGPGASGRGFVTKPRYFNRLTMFRVSSKPECGVAELAQPGFEFGDAQVGRGEFA